MTWRPPRCTVCRGKDAVRHQRVDERLRPAHRLLCRACARKLGWQPVDYTRWTDDIPGCGRARG